MATVAAPIIGATAVTVGLGALAVAGTAALVGNASIDIRNHKWAGVAYSYAGNSPLGRVDPDGRAWECTTVTISMRDADGNPILSPSTNCKWTFEPTDFDLGRIGRAVQQTAQQVSQAVIDYVSAPRDLGCLANAAGRGASFGTGAGGVTGGILGGGGGTLLAPGPGTVGGALAGAAEGGSLGFQAGTAIGTGIGFIACSKGSGGSGGGSISRSGAPKGAKGNAQAI